MQVCQYRFSPDKGAILSSQTSGWIKSVTMSIQPEVPIINFPQHPYLPLVHLSPRMVSYQTCMHGYSRSTYTLHPPPAPISPLQACYDSTTPNPVLRRWHCSRSVVHRALARSRQMFPARDIWTCILAQCEATKPSICHTAVNPLLFRTVQRDRARGGDTYHRRIHHRH